MILGEYHEVRFDTENVFVVFWRAWNIKSQHANEDYIHRDRDYEITCVCAAADPIKFTETESSAAFT